MILLLLSIIFVSVTSCSERKNTDTSSTRSRVDNIVVQDTSGGIAAKLANAYNSKNYPLFLELFPGSFSSFLDLYGYDDSAGKKELYPSYEEHITYLFSPLDIKEKEGVYSKAFGIAVGGEWDADAPNFLRQKLIEAILSDDKTMIMHIVKQPEAQANKFWFFILDGPTSKDDLQLKNNFKDIYTAVNGVDKTQGLILYKKYNQMYPGSK